MAQNVTYQDFTLKDFQAEAGIQRLNLFFRNVVAQAQAQQGTTGTIQPDADIDMQGKWKVINQKP